MKAEELIIKNTMPDIVVGMDIVAVPIALTAMKMARYEEQERAIEAFLTATDGYFIIGGTDYSKSVIEAFKSKLSE